MVLTNFHDFCDDLHISKFSNGKFPMRILRFSYCDSTKPLPMMHRTQAIPIGVGRGRQECEMLETESGGFVASKDGAKQDWRRAWV